MNYSNYLFHASSTGKICTDSRTKDPLGETAKKHLMECWVEQTYGRRKEFTNKYIEKGLAAEEDSITLYSRVKKKVFFKNEETISNEFICGTPDIITDDEVIDIKTSWSIHTFYEVLAAPIKKDYLYQLQSYMALTGKRQAKLAYILVNAPDFLVNREKDYLARNMGLIDRDASPDYLAACDEIDKAMLFDDIPMEDRYIEILVDYDEALIQSIYDRVRLCRGFLNAIELSRKRTKSLTS
jgi:hypothetical protein